MILITGGAGYIGTHTCIELMAAGFDVVVLDNLSNSSAESINRARKIVGREITFVEGDVRSRKDMQAVFEQFNIEAVIHFAGLKAVGESVEKPLMYYDNNVSGTVLLCEVMSEFGCKKLVFSSSATVYGDPVSVPICEDAQLMPTNPYGQSKLMVENILKDIYTADNEWSICILRYFNPVGAHKSGLVGEHPNGVPNNLMPYVSQVAVGKRDCLDVFGDDYATADGTGVRDYIHVVDLAKGHVKAVLELQLNGVQVINLGTGKGYSVLDIVKAFERASGKKVPFKVVGRRSGDIAQCFSDPSNAAEVLAWTAERSLDDMCQDAWRWQSNNPNGYDA